MKTRTKTWWFRNACDSLEFIFTNIKAFYVQILKILTLLTLKSSQSNVALKNECKQLCYYFPNEIKNSSYPNEKILKLKQQGKIRTIQKNIFINCPRGKLPSTHNLKTKPNPNPNQGAIFLEDNCLVAPSPKTNSDLDRNPNPNRGAIFLGRQLSEYRSTECNYGFER